MDIQRLRLFRNAMRRFERISSSHLSECCVGLTQSQCHVLLEIGEHEMKPAVQIAKQLELDPSNLSRTVDELFKMGLVERRPHPSDRRYILLALTSRGRSVCNTINRQADDYFREVFQALPETEHETIVDSFTLLVRALGRCSSMHKEHKSCCAGRAENLSG